MGKLIVQGRKVLSKVKKICTIRCRRRDCKMAQKLIPESKEGLSKFKTEVANELGVPFTDYNGNLSSKQCGSVGGEMVKRMVRDYETKIK
jgi:small acid-soluble spore protein D (minor alpha/beta-type SASP)